MDVTPLTCTQQPIETSREQRAQNHDRTKVARDIVDPIVE